MFNANQTYPKNRVPKSILLADLPHSPCTLIRGKKDELFKRLKESAFCARIGVFITVKAPLDAELAILKKKAVSAQAGLNLETRELRQYHLKAYQKLHPLGVSLGKKIRLLIQGNNYKRKKSMVSLFTVEVCNRDGTVAEPHIHFVCEPHKKITTDLVTSFWKSIAGMYLPDNPVDVQYTPFRKGTEAVVRYILKDVTPETPADVYPVSLLGA